MYRTILFSFTDLNLYIKVPIYIYIYLFKNFAQKEKSMLN